ncbi:hypothetical protein ACFWP3_03735 [Streptomyces sp. NPDC058525]|uniref:hypothetical protein n=1 Tax=Streptomyces sp. NPDC058525 TaxID=3346538 RepID=UPI003650BE36
MPAPPAAPAAAVAGYEPERAPRTTAEVYADSLVVLSAPNERRPGARRRATHRRRRRTVLTMGLGLLIATAGTLAVARMATDGQRSDRAATVVLTDDGPQQPAPLPDASTPRAPEPAASGKASGAAKATGPAAKTGAPAQGAGGAAQPEPPSSAPAPTASGPASGTPSPRGSVKPTASGQQTPSGSATPPPPPPPAPTPTKDCGFLGFLCWGD